MDRAEHDIVTRALRALARLGLRARVLPRPAAKDRGTAAIVGLEFGGRRLRYAADVRRGLRPGTLGTVVHQLRAHRGRPLLVTDHVTPPLADALRERGVEFVDAAGNAFLKQPPDLVFVKGERPARRPAEIEPGRCFQPAGLQVLFALLAGPDLANCPYREIAAAAGTAHGTVGWVMAELQTMGHLARLGGRRRLIDALPLLDRWVEAYARTLRPRLLLGRFRGDLAGLQARTAWPDGILIGGELAAARLTRHLRPGTLTLYGEAIDPRAVVELRLRAEPDGNVDFRRRFWNFPGEDPLLTPRLLVYADLLAIGDARCLETAELLRGPLVARLV